VLFGPLGLFYSSLPAAVVFSLGAAVLTKDFGVYGLLFTWPAAVVGGFVTVRHWNLRAKARSVAARTAANSDITTGPHARSAS
jgi:hypothetical protein